jgi:hypothetical protein
MSAGVVTSLDDLVDGQHVAITTNNVTSRWTYIEGSLVNHEGRRVDPWFFSGAIEKGRLVHADFSPPQVREWFHVEHREGYHYLVVDTEGDDKRDNPFCARFAGDQFSRFTQEFSIIDTHKRCPAPEWANSTVVSLAVSAYATFVEKERMSSQIRRINDAKTYISYTQTYLSNALQSLEGTR